MALIRSGIKSASGGITGITYKAYNAIAINGTYTLTSATVGKAYMIVVHQDTSDDHLVVTSGGTLLKADSSAYSNTVVGYIVIATDTSFTLSNPSQGLTRCWIAEIN